MKDSVRNRQATRPDHSGPGGHHTCVRCPVCGKEECAVLQDLGMACDTAQAAEASGKLPGRMAEPPPRVRRVSGAYRR